MTIVYLHGLSSTHRSFSYIVQQLPAHDHVMIDYESAQPLDVSIGQIVKKLPKGDITLIGHSLGGLIATIIAATYPERVSRLVTISSPLGGSKSANTLRWMPGTALVLRDIGPSSPAIRMCNDVMLPMPMKSIVSTAGDSPLIPEPNDGVIEVSSQISMKCGTKVEVKANHFEVLLHEKTAKIIKDFLNIKEPYENRNEIEIS